MLNQRSSGSLGANIQSCSALVTSFSPFSKALTLVTKAKRVHAREASLSCLMSARYRASPSQQSQGRVPH